MVRELLFATYTEVDVNKKQRIVYVPLTKAVVKGHFFVEDDKEYHIYECDKPKLKIALN